MAGTEQQNLGAETGIGPGLGCRADDLRGFLQQLSDQIVDADRRHTESLRDMRDRLARLGDHAGNAKHSLPKAFEADLERLETGMSNLAQRMSDGTSHKPVGSAEANKFRGLNDSASTTASHVVADCGASSVPLDNPTLDARSQGEARAVLASPPPALKSAIIGASGTTWSRTEPHQEAPHLQISPPLPSSADDEPWDRTSAEALAQIYESGQAGVPCHTPSHDQTMPTSTIDAVGSQSVTPSTAFRNVSSGGRLDIDRAWIESQLSEMAARVEQSFAALRPDNAIVDLGRRFDQLEERWATALTDIVTRSDVEGLRIVESHIADLSERLDKAQVQLARLDVIEHHLADVAGQLSDDQIVKLFGGLVPTEEDLTHFAETAAEKVAARMFAGPSTRQVASGSTGASFSPMEVEASQIESSERIVALQEMLSSFIDEQRRGEVETNEALETMQHAMQHMLDHVDAFEGVRAPAVTAQPAGEAIGHQTTTSEPAHTLQFPAQNAFEEAKAAAKAAAAAVGRASPNNQPKLRQADDNRSQIETSLNASLGELVGDVEFGSRGQGDRGRNSVLETARRAAERARQSEVSRDAQKPKTGFRDRFIGGASKNAGGEKLSVQRGILLVTSVGALLLAGYWFLAGPKARMIAPGSKVEQSMPARAGKPLPSNSLPIDDDDEVTKALAKPTGVKPPVDTRTDMQAPASPREPQGKRAPNTDTSTKRGAATDRVELNPGFGPEQLAGNTIAGSVTSGAAGIAIQKTRPNSQAELLKAREQMHIATLSQQTAQHAAQMMAAQPAAMHASLQEQGTSQSVAPSQQDEGRTVLELPPALIGPLSLRLAAAKGDPSAQFEVAARFAEGKGVKQDFGQAAAWYSRAATQGLATAQYRLAALYERGLGVKSDAARARTWYKRAAEQGNVKAMHNLAVLSAGRDHGAADYAGAVQWFSEAAERGLPDSQYNLGVLYESGLGVSKDAIAAYKWYAIAARNGDREAKRRHEALRSRLDPLSLQSAEQAIASWQPRSVETAANDSIAAGIAWKYRASGNGQ